MTKQQVDALMNLIDEYAEVRHINGCWVYNSKTASARQAVIEALSGVQALSAVPSGWKLVPLEPSVDQEWKGKKASLRVDSMAEACKIYKAMLAASPTPPAEQATPKAAPGVGNSGFDHQTAADFLNGKTISDEAVRKFVQAARWAHDEKASLSAMLISVRGELASRNAEIALLKRALMEAEAAHQPAPAPLIARSLAEWHEQDGNVAWWVWDGREWAGEPAWIGNPNCEDWPGYHTHWTPHPEQPVFAALASQGGG